MKEQKMWICKGRLDIDNFKFDFSLCCYFLYFYLLHCFPLDYIVIVIIIYCLMFVFSVSLFFSRTKTIWKGTFSWNFVEHLKSMFLSHFIYLNEANIEIPVQPLIIYIIYYSIFIFIYLFTDKFVKSTAILNRWWRWW